MLEIVSVAVERPEINVYMPRKAAACTNVYSLFVLTGVNGNSTTIRHCGSSSAEENN
jgi:hypothetical protein